MSVDICVDNSVQNDQPVSGRTEVKISRVAEMRALDRTTIEQLGIVDEKRTEDAERAKS